MRIPAVLAVVLFLAAATSARAEDAEAPKPHTDAQLEEHEVFEKFAAGWEREHLDERMAALRQLGRWRHKRVLKELKKIWLRAEEPEIVGVAAEGLGNQTPFRKDAAKLILKRLETMEDWGTPEGDEEDDDVQVRLEAQALVATIHALGALEYRDAWDTLKDFIEHYDDEVAGETMLVFGRWKEYRALPLLLEWFNYYPDGYSWSGGSVKVDTGAAGGQDARAAKAKWKAKYGSRKRKARPGAWDKMVQAVEMITGEKFEKPEQLKAWMDENKVLLRKHGV